MLKNEKEFYLYMNTELSNKCSILTWVSKTTLINVLLVAICFAGILTVMIFSYEGGDDISDAVIGNWKCVQFYKNQKSFQVPETQNINVSITDEGKVTLVGSENASIFRGSSREGNYKIEGGSTLYIDMGNEVWTCACVFTQDRLLRMSISEAEMVLYLKKVG